MPTTPPSIARVVRHFALLVLVAARGVAAQGTDAAAGVRSFEAGRYAEARTRLAAAARADARDTTALFYLGRTELAQGNGEAAAGWLERATKLAPRNSAYFYWLGTAYGRQAVRASRFTQARLAGRIRGALERAVALDADNLDARSGLLQYYVVAPKMMGGSVDRARAQAREIARRSPFRGHLAVGVIAERQKEWAAAEREYRGAVSTAPDSAIGYSVLGDLYRRRGQYDQAFATFAELRRRLPGEAGALYLVGRTAAVSGQRLAEGEAALTQYLAARRRDTDPPLASAHFRLGTIYEKQGRRDLARAEYTETLRLDPEQSEARDGLKRVK